MMEPDRYFIDTCSQLTAGFMSASAVPTDSSDNRARFRVREITVNLVLLDSKSKKQTGPAAKP